MKKILVLAAMAAGFAAPVLAADSGAMACAAFNALDDAGKLALAPEIKTLEPVATTEPLQSQDGAELIASATQACSEYPEASLVEALSQLSESLKSKG